MPTQQLLTDTCNTEKSLFSSSGVHQGVQELLWALLYIYAELLHSQNAYVHFPIISRKYHSRSARTISESSRTLLFLTEIGPRNPLESDVDATTVATRDRFLKRRLLDSLTSTPPWLRRRRPRLGREGPLTGRLSASATAGRPGSE
jgi:hypothetical protein